MKTRYWAFARLVGTSIALLLFLDSQASELRTDTATVDTLCGTTILPEEFALDRFYEKDNQVYVDILRENGFAIPSDYLKRVEMGDALNVMSAELLSLATPSRQIPIKAWIYRNNDGSGNISHTAVRNAITELNDTYRPLGIYFYLQCTITEINNTNYANNGHTYYSSYTAANRVSGAINVHIVIDAEWAGVATLPWQTRPFTCAVQGGLASSSTLAHEIGHTLGLYHTHESARNSDTYNEDAGDCYQESVSRTRTQGVGCVSTIGSRKSVINGDQHSDTQADPGLRRSGRATYVDAACNYLPALGGTDNWGETWTPDVTNIMSYSLPHCRTHFSPMQIAKMISYINDIGISPPSFFITGPVYLCPGQTGTYSVQSLPGTTTYTWETPPGLNITAGQGTNSITVQATAAYTGTITVTPDCGGPIAGRILPDASNTYIQGEEIVCPDEGLIYIYDVTPVATGDTYNWTVQYGQIVSGQGTYQLVVVFEQSPSNSSQVAVTIQRCGSPMYLSKNLPHNELCVDASAETKSGMEKSMGIRKLDMGSSLSVSDPVSDSIDIIPPDNRLYDLVLFDIQGEPLLRKNDEIRGRYTLDLTSFPEGSYFVYLIGEKDTYSKKVVIER